MRESHGWVFLLSFLGYLVVGLGSIGFHSTLKCKTAPALLGLSSLTSDFELDTLQLVDELSMIYTTCIMCFATFSHSKSRRYSAVLGIGLVGLAVFITVSEERVSETGRTQALTRDRLGLLPRHQEPKVPSRHVRSAHKPRRVPRHVHHGMDASTSTSSTPA